MQTITIPRAIYRHFASDASARLDGKGDGTPCGGGWISKRKKCSKKGAQKLAASLKAGDKGAIARVQAGKKKAAERSKLKREVAEDAPLRSAKVIGGKTASKQALDQFDNPSHEIAGAAGTGKSSKQVALDRAKSLGLPEDFYEVSSSRRVTVDKTLGFDKESYGLASKYKHKDWDANEKSLKSARESRDWGIVTDLKQRREDMMRVSTAKARGESPEKPFERLIEASKNDLERANALPSGGNSGKRYQQQEASSNIKRAESAISSLKKNGTLPWEKQPTVKDPVKKSRTARKSQLTREMNKTLRAPDPKKFDREKLNTFVGAVSGRGSGNAAAILGGSSGPSSVKGYLKQSLEKNKGKFQKGEIKIKGSEKDLTVSGEIIGDLAVIKGSDIAKGQKGYSLTHIPSGMAVANVQRAKDAKAAAAGLQESGIDWGGNPNKFSKDILFQLGQFSRTVSDKKFRVDSFAASDSLPTIRIPRRLYNRQP
jgi:hypothetical protein